MKSRNLLITIIILLVTGAGSFYGGMLYQKSTNKFSQPGQFSGGVRSTGLTRNGNQIGRPVNGEISSVENNTMTIKTDDGSSKIIIYSDSTKVNKTSEGLKDDLKVGEQIMVIGSEGSDGTITAQSISLGGNYMRIVPTVEPTGN